MLVTNKKALVNMGQDCNFISEHVKNIFETQTLASCQEPALGTREEDFKKFLL